VSGNLTFFRGEIFGVLQAIEISRAFLNGPIIALHKARSGFFAKHGQ
jgi:hypothetical protein